LGALEPVEFGKYNEGDKIEEDEMGGASIVHGRIHKFRTRTEETSFQNYADDRLILSWIIKKWGGGGVMSTVIDQAIASLSMNLWKQKEEGNILRRYT
jgi:hypothetical protein